MSVEQEPEKIVVQKKPTKRQSKDEDPFNMDYVKEMKRMQKI